MFEEILRSVNISPLALAEIFQEEDNSGNSLSLSTPRVVLCPLIFYT